MLYMYISMFVMGRGVCVIHQYGYNVKRCLCYTSVWLLCEEVSVLYISMVVM